MNLECLHNQRVNNTENVTSNNDWVNSSILVAFQSPSPTLGPTQVLFQLPFVSLVSPHISELLIPGTLN